MKSLVTLLFLWACSGSVLGQDDPLSYTSYTKRAVCTPSQPIRYPTTIEEVQSIVREAIVNGTTVKAFGHRHSLSDCICTDGVPIDMMGLSGPNFMSCNPVNNVATFGAGVQMRAATQFLRYNCNKALKVTPAFGNITVGGAIGTGAHGSTLKWNSSLSVQVKYVKVVDGRGDLITVTDPADLQAFRTHLGCLGIVVEVTFDVVDYYKMRANSYMTSDTILMNGNWSNMVKEADAMLFYWYPQWNKVVVFKWDIVPGDTPGEAWTAEHAPPTSGSFNTYALAGLEAAQAANDYTALNVVAKYSMQWLVTTVPDFAPIFTEDGLTVKQNATGSYDLMSAPICTYDGNGSLPGNYRCFWKRTDGLPVLSTIDNEVGIPVDNLQNFFVWTKAMVSKTPQVFHMEGIYIRFSRENDILMSNAYGRNTAHIEWYPIARLDRYNTAMSSTAANQLMMQYLTDQVFNDGRSHWGKSGMWYHSKDKIDQKFMKISQARAQFVATMDKYDPNGIFSNKFSERIRGGDDAQDLDPQSSSHCALEDNCICQQDSDCASGQKCGVVAGYPYSVCINTVDQNPINLLLYNTLRAIDPLCLYTSASAYMQNRFNITILNNVPILGGKTQ